MKSKVCQFYYTIAEKGRKWLGGQEKQKKRKEKNASSSREKTILRYCIVNIKFIHFIIFITALKFKSGVGNIIYRTYLTPVF